MKVNGDYIWATYNGQTNEEVMENLGKSQTHTLVVFDKKGVPLGKFIYPNSGLKICFSKDGEYLYLFTNSECNIERVRVEALLDML